MSRPNMHPFKALLIKKFMFKDFISARRAFNTFHESHDEVDSICYPETPYEDLFIRIQIRLKPVGDQNVGDAFVVFTTQSYKGHDKVIGVEHVVDITPTN